MTMRGKVRQRKKQCGVTDRTTREPIQRVSEHICSDVNTTPHHRSNHQRDRASGDKEALRASSRHKKKTTPAQSTHW